MTRLVFNYKGNKKGRINSYVLHKAYKKNPCKRDVIRLECVNTEGSDFIRADVMPEEALLIAHALLKAHTCWWVKEIKKKEKEK